MTEHAQEKNIIAQMSENELSKFTFYYRAMSPVWPFVTLMDCDHTAGNSSKLISRLNSLDVHSLQTPT